MRPSDVQRFGIGIGKAAIFAVTLLVASSGAPVTSLLSEHLAGLGLHPGQTYASISQQTVHDVAVTDLQASTSSVLQGDVVTIDVTVQNLGSGPETFNLSLRHDTDSRELNAISLSLDPGQTLTIGFQWDTSAASSGLHLLSAIIVLESDQVPANNSLTLASPIEVKAQRIILGDGTGLDLPDASFGAQMQEVSITTQSIPATSIFLGVHDASLEGALVRAAVTTQESPHQSIFVANADATFQPGAALQDPFGQGEVRGVVHLEGDASSLGSYIQVGQNTHFVESSGSFRIMAPSGTFDILIDAPGYVPVRAPRTQINPGEVLNLPELTLPFGDANSDGKIDILDLNIAASNFGETVVEVAPP